MPPCVSRTRMGEESGGPVAPGTAALGTAAPGAAALEGGPTAAVEVPYRVLVEEIPAITYLAAIDEVFSPLYVSPQLESLLGYAAAEWVARPELWSECLHADDRARVLAAFARMGETGETAPLEYRLLHRDGRVRWFRDEARVLRDETGRPVMLRGFMTDITDRREAEQGLRGAEARYRALVEEIPAIVFLDEIGPEGIRPLYVSPQIEAILGFSPEEWLSDAGLLQRRLHPDDRARVVAQIERYHATGQPFVSEYRLIARDGRVVWVHDADTGWADDTSGSRRSQGVILDITALREAERALRRRDAILAALADVSQRLLAGDAPDEAFPAVLASLGGAAGAARAYVLENDLVTGGATYRMRHVWPDPARGGWPAAERPRRYPGGTGGRWVAAFRAGRPVVETVGQLPAAERHAAMARGVRSFAAVPVFCGGEWWGVLGLADDKVERSWSAAEVEALRSVAGALGAALARRASEEAEREQRGFAEALGDSAAALNSTLEVDDVLDRILADVRRVVAHDTADVMLVEDGVARVVRHRGYAERGLERHAADLRIRLETMPLLLQMTRDGKPAIVADTRTDPAWTGLPRLRWIRSYLGAAIRVEGEVIGFLNLDSARAGYFRASDAERLQAFADQAGVAIQHGRLFAELRAGREQLRQLSRRLLEIQEAERRHLARELHDEVGQALTAINLALGATERAAAGDRGAALAQARGQVNELISRVRSLSLELRPAMLDDLGLLPAILWLVERYAGQGGLRVDFEQKGLERRFPAPVETAAYRVVQEALTNAARHADVADVRLRLRAGTRALRIEIRDEGRGFDPEATPAAGAASGLAGMRERVALLGGRLAVSSGPGAGTIVEVEIPLRGGGQRPAAGEAAGGASR